MKFLILILVSVLCNFSFAQNRNKIIKEVSTYKYELYSKSRYNTTSFELKSILNKYLKKRGYKIHMEDSLNITFTKLVTVSCSKHPGHEKDKFRAEKYEKCKAKFYVALQILDKKNGKHVLVNTRLEEYNVPMTAIYKKRMLGSYKFKKLNLYEFLHQHYHNTGFILPKELITKIENYNAKQTKEQKKLIADRDY